MEKIKILGINVDRVDMGTATNRAIKKIENGEKFFTVTPNSEIIVNAGKNKRLFDLINNADMVVPDGIGLVIASKILKSPLKERVTGIDLMLNLIDYAAKNGKTVFLLGGKKTIAEKAKAKLISRYPDLNVVGTMHGYYKGLHCGYEGDDEEIGVVEKINSLSPDMLFVAMGSPAQEFFIQKYISRIDAKLFMGVGGSLDVISGEVKRAPLFFQKHGLEWLYRIVKEPKRIIRSLSLPIFALKVIFKRDKK